MNAQKNEKIPIANMFELIVGTRRVNDAYSNCVTVEVSTKKPMNLSTDLIYQMQKCKSLDKLETICLIHYKCSMFYVQVHLVCIKPLL